MHSESFVKLVVNKMGLSQKDLAIKLGVSPTQITKWKKGEFMSFEMDNKFRSLTGIGDLDPDVVLMAGSMEDAVKWEELIRFLAHAAKESAETGYNTEPLTEDSILLTSEVFRCFRSVGIDIPKTFPKDLDFDYNADLGDSPMSDDELEFILNENPYSSAIYSAFLGLNDLFGFYAAYISELEFNEKLGLMETEADNISPCLIDLAFARLDLDRTLAPNLSSFRFNTLNDYKRWINIVKSRAWESGVPVRAELMKLVTSDNGDVGAEAERESLGFNAERIHPDIYMNELLIGMRVIHQIFPEILKKLEIEDFELDMSELSAR